VNVEKLSAIKFQELCSRLITVAIAEALPLKALPARVFSATVASPVWAMELRVLLIVALLKRSKNPVEVGVDFGSLVPSSLLSAALRGDCVGESLFRADEDGEAEEELPLLSGPVFSSITALAGGVATEMTFGTYPPLGVS
jgi:hypothetical protein